MSTTATFRGVTFQGVVLTRRHDPVTGQWQEWSVFGLAGASQLSGSIEAENVDVLIALNGFASAAAIENYEQNVLRPLVNQLGTLTLAGAVNVVITSVTLRSSQRVEHDQQHGPLPNNPHSLANRWTDHVKLSFRKLK